MQPIAVGLLVVLLISLAGNAFQAYLARNTRKKPRLDLSAQELLHDLTRRGGAVVKVEVIDAANLLLRSPKG
jgi:hypothetical protein